MAIVHYNPTLTNDVMGILDDSQSALIQTYNNMEDCFQELCSVQGFGLVDIGPLVRPFTTLSKSPGEINSFETAIHDMAELIQTYGSDLRGEYVFENGKCYVFYNQGGWIDENGVLHRWDGGTVIPDMYSSGCGPTSMAAILASYFDKTITPETVTQMMEHDDCNDGGRFFEIFEKYDLDYTTQEHLSNDVDRISSFIKSGGTMIISVNVYQYNPATNRIDVIPSGHYMSVLGVDDSKNPPEFIVCDPYNNDPTVSAYHKMTFEELTKDRGSNCMTCFVAPPGETVDDILPPLKNT